MFVFSRITLENLGFSYCFTLTLEASKKNTWRGGGGVSRTPRPSTFDTIHPIDMKFSTYNKLHLYFQLI